MTAFDPELTFASGLSSASGQDQSIPPPNSADRAVDVVTPRDLAATMQLLTGHRFRLFRPGNIGVLSAMIRLTRLLAPQRDAVFPAWQGMQYLRDMMEGTASWNRSAMPATLISPGLRHTSFCQKRRVSADQRAEARWGAWSRR